MNIVTKYLLIKYLKYFFIILLSLEIFFVGIDFLQIIHKLPDSANLQLLYILYNAFFTLTIALPLSLVFGWIVILTSLIKNNELVSFYALGISEVKLLKPIINIAIFISILLITLQTTPLAYSYEMKNKILNDEYFISEQDNIFLKYNEYFVYFKKLYPLEKKATGVHIFKIEDDKIVEQTIAKKAIYQGNRWYIIDTKVIKKPKVIDWDNSKLEVTYEKFSYILEGFEPKIINNVYKTNTYFSTIDAIRTILLLDNQDFNTNKIRSILYSQLLVPFFVLPLIVLIFVFTSASSRFFNTAAFISITIFSTLLVWGVLFLMQKLALGSVLLAEIAIILPLVVLFLLTYYIYNRKVG
ncbi:MAG: LptF/LptG family permease [Campylobacterota bacterium]|nr:LptF/LptG family permease [Campylobacterota bacterium]